MSTPFNCLEALEPRTFLSADAIFGAVFKEQKFDQTRAGTPVIRGDGAFRFGAFLLESSSDPDSVNGVTVQRAGGEATDLSHNDGSSAFNLQDQFNSKSALDAAHPNGKYTLTLDTANDGEQSLKANLLHDAYPKSAPHIVNFTALQKAQAGRAIKISFDPFTGGTAADFLVIDIEDANTSETVFNTGFPGQAGALNGLAKSVTLPAHTLLGGHTYSAHLSFINVVSTDLASYPGAIGAGGYNKETEFSIRTVADAYEQTNLVSSGVVEANTTDPNLINPWGIAASPTGPWWVADNENGTSTLYDGEGVNQNLIVSIPAVPNSNASSVPTGIVYNPTSGFAVAGGGAAQFIFAGENGIISGWNSGTDAIIAVDRSAAGAVYKGLAMGKVGNNTFLYATNFHSGKIEVYKSNFTAARLRGKFADRAIPAGFAPFNIQNIAGKLYVSYAKQDEAKAGDVAGAGNGFVDVFNTNGTLIKHLVSRGHLNSPWGLTIAPRTFGLFAGALLVGNFGDGRINAFNPSTGKFLGQLARPDGSTLAIDGLWALSFGNGGSAGSKNTLFFTAGPNDESDGIFGSIAPAAGEPGIA